MKKMLFIIVIVFIYTNLFSSDWEILNNFPEYNNLYSVDAYNAEFIATCGEDGIIRISADSGFNWTSYTVSDKKDLKSIKFINKKLLFSTGSEGRIFKSLDSGKSWEVVVSNVSQSLNAIENITNEKILVAGDNGILLLSTDNGVTFNLTDLPTNENLLKVKKISEGKIIILGSNGTVLISNDNGGTWSLKYLGEKLELKNIEIIDDDTYVVIAKFEYFFRTDDGGETWKKSKFDSSLQYNTKPLAMKFVNSQIGCVFAIDINNFEKEYHYYTTNGGISWFSVIGDYGPDGSNDYCFYNDKHGFAVGEDGEIVKVTLVTWIEIITNDTTRHLAKQYLFFGLDVDYSHIYSYDEMTYTLVIKRFFSWNYYTELYITNDFGLTWELKRQDTAYGRGQERKDFYIEMSAITSPGNFVVVADSQQWFDEGNSFGWRTYPEIKISSNNGNTWSEKKYEEEMYPYYIDFIDELHGIIVFSSKNGIYITNDGGKNWTVVNSPDTNFTTFIAKRININTIITYMFQNGSRLLAKTTNLGEDWEILNNIPRMNNLAFINENTGWILINEETPSKRDKYVVAKTTDFGKSWVRQLDYVSTGNWGGFESIKFIDSLNGCIGGWQGTFFRTTDGGNSWAQNNLPNMKENERVENIAYSSHGKVMVHTNFGCLARKTFDVNDVKEPENNKMEFLIFPNPAKEFIQLTTDGITNVNIYNSIGNHLGTYLVEYNSIQIDVSDYPSGLYFVRINDKISSFIKL